MEDSASRCGVPSPGSGPERGAAALSTLAGFGALFSAAACCILPLALSAVGLSAGGLAAFVPFHWPLTSTAVVALAVGGLLYAGKWRACYREPSCAVAPPMGLTLVMLCLATIFVIISALWGFVEAPLMRSLGGA